MLNLLSVSPPKHQGCVWSCLKDSSLLPTAQQDLELWLCHSSQPVFGATVILLWCAKFFHSTHFEEENHLSKLFQGKGFAIPPGTVSQIYCLAAFGLCICSNSFSFFFSNCVFYFFRCLELACELLFPSIPSKI